MLRYLILTVTTALTLSMVNSKIGYQLPYVGNWHLRAMFYSSHLTINKDGTFKFIQSGCTGSCYTEGVWSNDKTGIILTSYKRFQEMGSDYIDKHSTISSIKATKSTKGANWTYQPASFIITKKISFGIGDTSTTYFNKARLTLKSDTLYMAPRDTLSTTKKYVAK